MSVTFRQVRWLFAALMMASATRGMAEALPKSSFAATITPEIIRKASPAAEPSRLRASSGRNELAPPDMFHGPPPNLQHFPHGCAHDSGSLCFDYRTGRAVYKPTRKLLPAIPGMTPHNLSIRRNMLVAQYTFK